MKDVLVIVPCFNEAKALASTLSNLISSSADYDILVVDDASHDNTYEVAKSIGVEVVRLPINLGIGGAVQTGFCWAARNKYKVAVQFDGDGQHRPEYLKQLVEGVLKGDVDLTIGSRFLDKGEVFDTTLARSIGMKLFSLLYSLLTGCKITDTTSGLRAASYELVRFFEKNYPVDFPDMPALLAAHKQGFRIKEIPVRMRQRQHGVSSIGFWKSFYYPLKTIFAALAVYARGKQS